MEIFLLLVLSQIDSNRVSYEIQMPFDTEGNIYEIDYVLARQIEFFKDYTEVQKALLFLQPDSSLVLEIYSKKNGNIIKERVGIQPETISQIQKEIEMIMAKKKLEIIYDRSGYANFLGNSFLFAYAVQAPLVVMGSGPDDFRTGVAIYMLSSASGFIIPLMLTRNCNVSKAHASMFAFGGAHGLYIAWALSAISGVKFYEGPGAFFTVSGSIIGEYIGFQSVNRFNLNVGRGNTVCIIGDFAGVSAAGMLSLFDNWSNPRFGDKHYLSMSIAGFGAGLFAGASITRNLDLADGDQYIFGHCGIAGGFALPIILSWADSDEGGRISEKIYISAGITGLGLGSILGYRIVKNKNFTEGEGNIITLGGIAGALTGLGLVYLANIKNGRAYYTGLLLGDIAGALTTASIIKAGNSEKHSHLHIHPEAVFCLGLSSVYHIPTKNPVISFNF